MPTTLVGSATVQKNDAREQQPNLIRHCDACDAQVPVDIDAKEAPGRWGDVWLCDDCRRTLPEEEIGRRSREIALRGVPLS